MKINIKSFFTTFLIILWVALAIFENNLNYIDEVVTIIFFLLYTFYFFINNKAVENRDKKIYILLIFLLCVGFISNGISKIQKDIFPILVDSIGILKLVITYLFFKIYLKSKNVKKISNNLCQISKIFIVISTIMGIISLFYDIGMGGEKRFGIYGYQFLFSFQHTFAIVIMSAYIIILIDLKDNKKIMFYTILVCINQILTTKGPSILWVGILCVFSLYYRRNKKISIRIVVILIFLGIIFGQYQIKTYFLNENAPRAILLKYSFNVANDYLPLGAGFATYGSEMAKRYNTSLHDNYGFNDKNGSNYIKPSYLNDNYWPMIIGQFGYVGAVIQLLIFYFIFLNLQENCKELKIKNVAITTFAYLMIHSLGSAMFTSSDIILISIVLVMCEINSKKEKE